MKKLMIFFYILGGAIGNSMCLQAAEGRDLSQELLAVLQANILHEERIQKVRKLISEGANVNVADENGMTPLMYAVWNNDLDIVQDLLNAGADHSINNANRPEKDTALILAARRRSPEIMIALLDAGADPYRKNSRNENAFFWEFHPAIKGVLAKWRANKAAYLEALKEAQVPAQLPEHLIEEIVKLTP